MHPFDDDYDDSCSSYDDCDDFYDDDDEWGCWYPDQCLMSYTSHMRSECHTVEMVEAYERACNPWWTRAYDWLLGIGLAVSLMPGRVMRRLRGKRCAHCGRSKCDDCQSCDLPF